MRVDETIAGRMVIIAALIVSLALNYGEAIETYLGCYTNPIAIPILSTVAYVDNTTLSTAACCQRCSDIGEAFCSMTEATTCVCSYVAPTFLAVPPTCNTLCPASTSKCGSTTANTFAVYNSGSGGGGTNSPNFTLPAVTAAMTFTFAYTASREEFIISFGDGTPPTSLIGVNNTAITFIKYLVPGLYDITVTGQIPGSSSSYSLKQELWYNATASIDYVQCPLIAYPNTTYICNISISYMNSMDYFSMQFNDSSSSNLSVVGNSFSTVGTLTPKGPSNEADEDGPALGDVVFLISHPIPVMSQLIGIDFYPFLNDSFSFSFMAPTCAGGLIYCMYLGVCLASCPDNPAKNSFSCPGDAFCFQDDACCTFAVSTTAATWASVSGPYPAAPLLASNTQASQLSFLTGAPIILQPTWVLQVKGALRRRLQTGAKGDWINDIASNFSHYVTVTIKELHNVTAAHQCTTVLNNVMLTVSHPSLSPPVPVSSSPSTMCERNITSFTMTLNQTETSMYNALLNSQSPYYVWSGYPFQIFPHFPVAGPIYFNLTFTPLDTLELNDLPVIFWKDYPIESGPYIESINRTFTAPAVYTLDITAYNDHNLLPDSMTGIIPNGVIQSTVIIAQNPISPLWAIAANTATPNFFYVPNGNPSIKFTDSNVWAFPTNATVTINWGDLTIIESLDFVDPGTAIPILSHNYTKGGTYLIVCNITNIVSGVFNLAVTITVYEDIQGYSVTNGYYLTPTETTPRQGFGKIDNMFPMDKNVSFFPIMIRGTVEQYKLTFTNNGSLLQTYTVTDIFHPTNILIWYKFNVEAFCNLTLSAVNMFQTVPFDLYIQIIDQVQGLQIIDYAVVSKPKNLKTFAVTFVSVGGGTCLLVDFGDLSDYVSIGLQSACVGKFPHVPYNASITLEITNNFTHIYESAGIYNVTAIAFNHASNETATLMFVVTTIPCSPPVVSIMDHAPDYLSARTLFKGEQNTVTSVATVKCSVTKNTKKRWQIFSVDELTGAEGPPIIMMNILPTWNTSVLVIPPAFLNYGMYYCLYTITMWDPTKLDVDMPFQTQMKQYISILPTPLKTKMTSTVVSKITIGLNQSTFLQPAVQTIDPDFPTIMNFSIAWKCRNVVETTWPSSTTPLPLTIGSLGTGCFGHGPGFVANPNVSWEIFGKDFLGLGTYEIVAMVTKDVRTYPVSTQLIVTNLPVPIVNFSCSSDVLCVPNLNGVGIMINANTRIGLLAPCIEYCDAPLIYSWTVKDENETIITLGPSDAPLGTNGTELSMASSYFESHPNLHTFWVTASVQNGLGQVGSSAYFMQINMKPTSGTCSLDSYTGKSLIYTFTLTCLGWIDPEGKGIKNYVVRLNGADGASTTLMEQQHTSLPLQLMPLVLPVGIFNISVTIKDVWGATTIFSLPQVVNVQNITLSEFQNSNSSQLIDELLGGGDTTMLNMVINSRNSIINTASFFNINDPSLNASEKQDLLLLVNSMNTQAVDALMSNPNFQSQESAEAAAGVLADIMSKASATPDGSLTIDFFTRGDIYTILDKLVEQIGNLPIGTPEEMRKLVESVATIAAGLVVSTGEVSSPGCKMIPPKDALFNANHMDYDTEVQSIEMTIPDNPDTAKKCNIMDLTKGETNLQMPLLKSIMDKMASYVLKKQVAGESMIVPTQNNMTVVSKILQPPGLPGRHYCGNSWIEFPDGTCPQGSCSLPVALSLKEWPTLIYIDSKNADLLTAGSRILDADVSDRNGNMLTIKNSPQIITMSLYRTFYGRGNSTPPTPAFVDAPFETLYQSIPIMYTTFNNTKNGTGFTIEISPTDTNNTGLFVMVMKSHLPTLKKYDLMTLVENIKIVDDGTYTWVLPVEHLNGSGQYYIGVAEFNGNITEAQRLRPMNYSSDLSWLKKPMTSNYTINIYSNGCYFYEKDTKTWKHDGMKPVRSSLTAVGCSTNHLTSFGGSMFAMPNTIDFSYVFAHMGFSDNLTIYVTLIICLTIFALLMIWGRIQDRKDLKKLGAAPLPDNLAADKYLYEILVFTGDKKEAQTDSTVQFVLTGDYGDTEIRTFGDEERKIFRKGDVSVFVMAVSNSLGPLSYLNIWHDNSGKGPNASWHLNYIVFKDVQTGQKYEFVLNDWLAVEKGDGQIERVIGVAGREQKSEFGFMFSNTSSRKLTDSHLWFSIFMRPPRSRFTRCQRVGTCFALLFLSMLANAMWYQTAASQPSTGSGLSIGPFSLTPGQIGIGVMSALISFPPSFLIAFIFRKSRPDKLRKSRIQEALEQASKQGRKKRGEEDENSEEETQKKTEEKVENSKDKNQNLDKKKKKKKKKKIILPAWCKYLGWALVFACIGVSVFFLLSYGVMFGNEKATKWITALVVSFFSSILFIQPVQVLLMAMLVSTLFKTEIDDEDDADDDEESPQLDKDQLWLYEGEKSKRLGYSKVQKEMLDELRSRRRNQLEMNSILKELLGYSIFISTLLLLSYGQRDPYGFHLKNSLMLSFVNFNQIDGTDFSQLLTTDDFWNYLPLGLMKPLRADVLYNGFPPYQLRGYLNDYANRIMGYATIRQIRAKKNACSISPLMRSVSKQCSGFSNIEDEESRNFCVGWNVPDTLSKNTSDCMVPEFQYETAVQLKSLPLWGQRGWYGGGGYVIHLSGKTKDILDQFTFLQKNFWINKMTRAVIIEFSTYNSQVNLFGICTLMIEYLPGSGVKPSYRFDAVSLFSTHNSFGSFVIACYILFCLFIIYFSFREFILFYKQGRHYFDSYWSYAEISIIIVAYLAIMLYFLREYETNKAVSIFKSTYGNGYVRMTYAVAINEYFGYAIAFLVFVGTIKFIKILRFNKRMGFLSATLKHCWDDLAGFMMAFAICFFSFVGLFFFLIGRVVIDFATFAGALATCFSMMMGKFQFKEIGDAHPLAPVMFFVFVVCTSFVLINLLITLIMKSFEEVKRAIAEQENEFEIIDYVWSQFKKVIGVGRQAKNERPVNLPVIHDVRDNDVNNDVSDLPSKVDKFLDYVNHIYFDGSMDWRNKEAIKGSFNQGRQILGADSGVGVDRMGFGKNNGPIMSPRNMFNGED